MAQEERLNEELARLSTCLKEKDAESVYQICRKYLHALEQDNEQSLALIAKRFADSSPTPLRRADVFALLDDPGRDHAPFAPRIDYQGRSSLQAAALTVFGNLWNVLMKTSFRTKKGDVRFFSYNDYLKGEDRRWKVDRRIQQDVLMHDIISGNLWCVRLLRSRFDRETADELVANGGGMLRVGAARQWGDITLQIRHALYRLGKLDDREAALCSELLVLGYNNDELTGCTKDEWLQFLNGYIRTDMDIQRSSVLCRSRYLQAGRLAAEGRYGQAAELYRQTGSLWSTDMLLKRAEKKQNGQQPSMHRLEKGERVTFGGWKQSRDPALSPSFSPIEWVVVKTDGERALLLAARVLATHAMADTATSGDAWRCCSLRRWLTGAFWLKAFSMEEKQLVIPGGVRNEDGTSDRDPVFLLSKAEAGDVLADNRPLWNAVPTAWAAGMKGAADGWWFRPDSDRKEVCSGKPGKADRLAAEAPAGVRPDLWIRREVPEDLVTVIK